MSQTHTATNHRSGSEEDESGGLALFNQKKKPYSLYEQSFTAQHLHFYVDARQFAATLHGRVRDTHTQECETQGIQATKFQGPRLSGRKPMGGLQIPDHITRGIRDVCPLGAQGLAHLPILRRGRSDWGGEVGCLRTEGGVGGVNIDICPQIEGITLLVCISGAEPVAIRESRVVGIGDHG